jgi:hypothetical protein
VGANLLELLGVLEEAEELLNSGMIGQKVMLLMAHGERLNPAKYVHEMIRRGW